MRFSLYGVAAIATLIASAFAQGDMTAPANSTTSASSIEVNHPKTLTTWTYNPIWPDTTTKQRALAPVATSRQQAVEIALRAFPTLHDVPENKIDFAIAPRKTMRGGPLISILDDAWAGMATWTPETIMLSVKESPGDKARRECHTDTKYDQGRELTLVMLRAGLKHKKESELTMPWMTIGCIVLGIVGIILFCVWSSPDKKPSYTAVQSSDIEPGLRTTTPDYTSRSDVHQDREK
ncbi:hypothetical protein FFLO_01624 [Filobasidium floriforme]|uniref:Uncharacterized protein n=1 Tax=Filobasidium floriforme TaxID=5210 RepID=A0A8K0JP73_9TREE|nr:uncharacterized protein HD553DRAFT_317171 [Filobasidium floriforme]KAG7562934.1 hypothetical protein FFLO_01624 [Filobasidium floriforme]KAH8080614.1 hypothetical protein HD553DRAFT_317171 [Filobasidium floriforme]